MSINCKKGFSSYATHQKNYRWQNETNLFVLHYNYVDKGLTGISILTSPSPTAVKWKIIEGRIELLTFITVISYYNAVQSQHVAVLCNCPDIEMTLFELAVYG